MTYLNQNEIAESLAMRNRVAAAVASEGTAFTPDADSWTFNYRRYWSAAPGWADAWASYKVSNPTVTDPGANEAVITDSMILSQIQAMGPTP